MAAQQLILLGIAYFLGVATPVALLRLLAPESDDTCFLNVMIVVALAPVVLLVIAFVAGGK